MSDEYEREIAKVDSTMLGYEGHGVFTAILRMNYGGIMQGVGNYFLDAYDEVTDKRVPSIRAGAFIAGVLRACGVNSWEQVKGRTLFVLTEKGKPGKPVGLENLPTEPGGRFLFAEAADLVDGESKENAVA